TLCPGPARETAGGKLVLTVTVLRDGAAVDERQITNSTTGRKEAAAALARAAGVPPAEAEQAVGKVLAGAREGLRLATQAQAAEAPLRDVVGGWVRGAWGLVCRTRRGAWSEVRGDEVGRADFVAHTPTDLLDLASAAADATEDRQGLIRAVQTELQVCWADLQKELPAEADVDLGADTAKGRQFRAAVVRLWTRPTTFDVLQGAVGGAGRATRASPVSRARGQAKDCLDGQRLPDPREPWRPIHEAFAGWWKPYRDPKDGEVRLALGMRWELGSQVGVELPGVA